MRQNLTRREALSRVTGVGALLATAPLAAAMCASAIPARTATSRETTTPRLRRMTDRSRVAFVKTTNRVDGIRQALHLIEPPSFEGKRLLLKPNLNSADPAPGSTHPDTLRTLATWLQERGSSKLIVGDRSGMGNTRQVMDATGVFGLARDLELEVLAFDELDESGWLMVQPVESYWSRGFPVPRLLREVDGVVQTCNLKTHRFGGHFTLSLKNSVGLVGRTIPGQQHDCMRELHSSPYQREMIAEINLAYRPDLIVLDGVEALVTGGPDRGQPAPAEVVLAGTDRVAIDAVGVALLRLWGTTPEVTQGSVFDQAQIRRAVELGLGAGSPEEIEIVTEDEPSRAYAARVRELLR